MSDVEGGSIVDEGVPLVELASGLQFGEGPAWDPHAHCLLFSDIASDVIHRWDETGGVTAFRTPSSMANGLAFDRAANLVICEHATSRLTRLDRDGKLTVLASHFGDRELNSPNDVVVSRDGGIWFTDPRGGREAFVGIPRPSELDFCGVYRLDPGGALELVVEDFELPNGLCFSPDERHIYINDTTRAHIRRLRVDGSKVLEDVQFAQMPGSGYPTPGVPDGMKCLSDGRLLATGPHGIWVFDVQGKHTETIETPGTSTNLAFGGDDPQTLFVTTLTGLYRLRLKVRGDAPVWAAR